MRDINYFNREFAYRPLQCVAVASRPLRVDELAEFLAFDFKTGSVPKFREGWRLPDPVEAVLSTCSTLLSVINIDGSQLVQFSLFPVKEYLTSHRLAETEDSISRRYHVSMRHAHTLAAQACLGLLLHLDEDTRLDNYPLAEYTAEHWIDHCHFENVSGIVEGALKRLFHPRQPHLAIWLWIYDPTLDFWERMKQKRAERPLPPSGTRLHYAARCGLHTIVKFLVIEHSQDVNSSRSDNMSTPLFEATLWGYVEVVRVLLECGADSSAQDNDEQSPLHYASFQENVKLARMLLEGGADLNAQDRNGQSPLYFAWFHGHAELARVILEGGADLNAQDKDGQSPLLSALSEEHEELARMLLERGADLSAQDKDGWSPLHFCVVRRASGTRSDAS